MPQLGSQPSAATVLPSSQLSSRPTTPSPQSPPASFRAASLPSTAPESAAPESALPASVRPESSTGAVGAEQPARPIAKAIHHPTIDQGARSEVMISSKRRTLSHRE